VIKPLDVEAVEQEMESPPFRVGRSQQIKNKTLSVTDINTNKKRTYDMRGVIHSDLKRNVIERFKKTLSDRPTLPGAFFKSFMSVETVKSELKTFENL